DVVGPPRLCGWCGRCDRPGGRRTETAPARQPWRAAVSARAADRAGIAGYAPFPAGRRWCHYGKPNGVLIRKAAPVTSPHPVPIAGDLDMSQNAFWEQPHAQRHAAYARLRAMQPPPFFEVPEGAD